MKRYTLFIIGMVLISGMMKAQSTVDTKIAVNSMTDTKTFVIIICNENYEDEEKVPYAKNDGEVFKIYCQKTLGIPENQIRFVSDATLNKMNREIKWLKDALNAFDGEARAIVYYSGHGIPDESSKEAFLLPVDGSSKDTSTGISTKSLYDKLKAMNSNSIIVFLDACFSGAKRDGSMLIKSRGTALKAKRDPVGDNTVVFSAAQGDETAFPYNSKQHGMFTYFLLEKMQQSGGCTTLGELCDYVTKAVKRNSFLENSKPQNPSVTVSSNNANWRKWKFASVPAKKYETRTIASTKPVSTPRTSTSQTPAQTANRPATNSAASATRMNSPVQSVNTSSAPVKTASAAPVDNVALSNLIDQGKKAMRAMNYESARKSFTQAANQGSIEAHYQLGLLYSNSNYDGYNRSTAIHYFLQAANANHIEAMYQAGMMYLGSDNYTAKIWFTRASEKGHQQAKAQLSRLSPKSSGSSFYSGF